MLNVIKPIYSMINSILITNFFPVIIWFANVRLLCAPGQPVNVFAIGLWHVDQHG